MIPLQSARRRPGATDYGPLRGVVRATLQTGGSQSTRRAQWRPIRAAPRGGSLVVHAGYYFSREQHSHGQLRRHLPTIPEGCVIVARMCAQDACRRRRRRRWRSRRRVAAPRPLEFSVPDRGPPTRDCNLDLLIAALRPRLSASQAESRVGEACRGRRLVADRPFEDDCLVVLAGSQYATSACGLARTPSGHFASAADGL